MTTTLRHLIPLLALALLLAACELQPAEEGATSTSNALTTDAGDEPAVAPPVGDGGCGCGRFVDEDGDGVCDLIASGQCRRGEGGRCACGRAAGDAGGGCGCGRHGDGFVDENGDGQCDHLGEGGHHGCGRGGPGFVDENGDGQCDHLGEGGHHGCGRGGPDFIDEDGDGQCDLMGERGCGCGRHQ